MNPLEHLCGIVDQKLRKMNRNQSSKHRTLGLLQKTWQKIPQDDIRKPLTSMPRKVLALKKCKGNVNQVLFTV